MIKILTIFVIPIFFQIQAFSGQVPKPYEITAVQKFGDNPGFIISYIFESTSIVKDIFYFGLSGDNSLLDQPCSMPYCQPCSNKDNKLVESCEFLTEFECSQLTLTFENPHEGYFSLPKIQMIQTNRTTNTSVCGVPHYVKNYLTLSPKSSFFVNEEVKAKNLDIINFSPGTTISNNRMENVNQIFFGSLGSFHIYDNNYNMYPNQGHNESMWALPIIGFSVGSNFNNFEADEQKLIITTLDDKNLRIPEKFANSLKKKCMENIGESLTFYIASGESKNFISFPMVSFYDGNDCSFPTTNNSLEFPDSQYFLIHINKLDNFLTKLKIENETDSSSIGLFSLNLMYNMEKWAVFTGVAFIVIIFGVGIYLNYAVFWRNHRIVSDNSKNYIYLTNEVHDDNSHIQKDSQSKAIRIKTEIN